MAEMSNFEAECTLANRYQTTIPENVGKALGLKKRDKIRYTIQANGQASVSKADKSESDPVLEEFLSFLALDIKNNPQHVQAISSDLFNRVQSLVADIELDLDAPLLDEDE